MNYSKIFVSLFMMSAGILSVSADKLSPDTRILLERKASDAKTAGTSVEQRTEKVFIAFKKGYENDLCAVPGVEVQSLFDGLATAIVTPDALDALSQLDFIRYVQIASKVELKNDWGRRELGVNAIHHNTGNVLPRPYKGKGVIVGIIDTGVEYGHHAFYNNDGTELRIRRAWEQEGFGTPPAGYTYGRELTTQQSMLEAACDNRTQFHGSHTMGTAAGGEYLNPKYYGMAPEADIVFVSFRNDDNTSIADGIKYIFDYADQMDMPCVINMSLGTHHGPHDGTSYLDQIIDNLTGPGRIIVGACGNEGEARLHASKTFTETDNTLKTVLTFNPQMGHKLHYIDIWGSPGSNLKVGMGVFNSLKGQTVDTSRMYDTSDPNQAPVLYSSYLDETGVDMDGVFYGDVNPENNTPHVYIQAMVGDIGQGRMPGLIIEGDPGATVHLWNEGQHEFSSNNLKGFVNGDNNCTVGEIGGTAKSIITVGSFDGRDSLIFQRNYYADMNTIPYYKQYQHSVFSSYGPTADGRTVPHILAPGMPVISALNRYGIDSETLEYNHADWTTDPSGRKCYYIYNMGTSMAAPHVAGIVALMLQANPELTPEQARNIIQATATTSADMGELPNNTFGSGRINALECVRQSVALAGVDNINDDALESGATSVWAANGQIHVLTPVTGATLRLYSVTGTLFHEVTLQDTETIIDASRWGRTVVVAEVAGETARSSFKLAL